MAVKYLFTKILDNLIDKVNEFSSDKNLNDTFTFVSQNELEIDDTLSKLDSLTHPQREAFFQKCLLSVLTGRVQLSEDYFHLCMEKMESANIDIIPKFENCLSNNLFPRAEDLVHSNKSSKYRGAEIVIRKEILRTYSVYLSQYEDINKLAFSQSKSSLFDEAILIMGSAFSIKSARIVAMIIGIVELLNKNGLSVINDENSIDLINNIIISLSLNDALSIKNSFTESRLANRTIIRKSNRLMRIERILIKGYESFKSVITLPKFSDSDGDSIIQSNDKKEVDSRTKSLFNWIVGTCFLESSCDINKVGSLHGTESTAKGLFGITNPHKETYFNNYKRKAVTDLDLDEQEALNAFFLFINVDKEDPTLQSDVITLLNYIKHYKFDVNSQSSFVIFYMTWFAGALFISNTIAGVVEKINEYRKANAKSNSASVKKFLEKIKPEIIEKIELKATATSDFSKITSVTPVRKRVLNSNGESQFRWRTSEKTPNLSKKVK